MNAFFLSLLFLVSCSSIAQDTLYHAIHMLGHEEFILYENGRFKYVSHQCGGLAIGYGTYQKRFMKYKFKYDTPGFPAPGIVQEKAPSTSDSLTLLFYEMVDSGRQTPAGSIVTNEKAIYCWNDSLRIAKKDLIDQQITFSRLEQDITFEIDTAASVIHFYLQLVAMYFSYTDSGIPTLKKAKEGYYFKSKVYDENPEKPWKKGKKRIISRLFEVR